MPEFCFGVLIFLSLWLHCILFYLMVYYILVFKIYNARSIKMFDGDIAFTRAE